MNAERESSHDSAIWALGGGGFLPPPPSDTRCTYQAHTLFKAAAFQRAIFLPFFATHYLDCDSFLSQCRIYQTDQRQNMSEWNIKTRLSSAFLIARVLTKRQRLHLLTASQRECKEITKSRLFPLDPALSCDFHFTVPVIAAVWLMLFVSFILSQSREDQHCTAPVLGGLISPKIHTCVFWDYMSAFGHLSLFKIIASFWENYCRVH